MKYREQSPRIKNVLLVEEINFISLQLCRILTLFGWKIFYLSLSKKYFSMSMINGLKRKNIFLIGNKSYGDDFFFDSNRYTPKLTSKILKKYIEKNPLNLILVNYFKMDELSKNRFDLTIQKKIDSVMGNLSRLIVFHNYLKKNNPKLDVFFMTKPNTFNIYLLKSLSLKLFPFNRLFYFVSMLQIFIRKIFEMIVSKRNQFLNRQKSQGATIQKDKIDVKKRSKKDFEILFFPHLGIYYGKLFIKDYFYSENLNSPLHPTNFIHLELDNYEFEDAKRSMEFYNNHNITYDIFLKRSSKDIITKLFVYFKILLKNHHFSFSIIVHYIYFLIFYHVKIATDSLAEYPKAKWAFIGYDIVFPLPYYLALSICKIETISIQERFIASFLSTHPLGTFSIDHYFVVGPASKEALKEHYRQNYCQHLYDYPPIRTDLFFQFNKMDEKYKSIKSKYKLVLAMDYNCATDELQDEFSTGNSWDLMARFYQDLISLSKEFPSLYFVIKSKDLTNFKNKRFETIFNEISALPNIEYELELDRYSPYELIGYADLGIGLYTMMADEMLALGKPVLIYNLSNLMNYLFNYKGYPIYISTYEELLSRMKMFDSSGLIMPADDLEKLTSEIYGGPVDGKVRQRIQEKILSLITNNNRLA